MNIESSRDIFLEDLETTMNLMAALNKDERVNITNPVVGMGLWRTKNQEVLLILKKMGEKY